MEFHKHICFINNTILNSNLLSEEDVSFLTMNCPEILLPASRNTEYITRKYPLKMSKFLHCFIVFLSISLAVFDSGRHWVHITVFTFVAIFISQKFFFRKANQPYHDNAIFLKSLIETNIDHQKVLRRCIRFIQDNEVAAMGYTLISGNTPISRLERSKQKFVRECMQLRYEVFKSATNFALLYRNETLDILGESNDFKFTSEICQIPLEELGPCFDQNTSMEHITNVTDNFCLDILRDVVRFMFQQRSEFLKNLVVKINKLNCNENTGLNDHLSNLFQTFSPLKISCDEASKHLIKVYNAHLNVENDLKSGSRMENTKDSTSRSMLNISLHSIQVHLRSALQVAIEAEQNCDEADEDFNLLLKDKLLPQVQIHVDATNQCIAETLKCLEPVLKENNIPKIRPNSDSMSNSKSLIDESSLNNQDEIREDQVFEATTEDLENDDTDKIDNDTEFQNMRKKRIEETTHVMKELKSVLHMKTSVEEREIRKQKLFPNYIPKTDNFVNICGNESSTLMSSTLPDMKTTADLRGITHVENISSGCFMAEGELPASSHTLLKLPRRPSIPGRTKRKKSHIRRKQFQPSTRDNRFQEQAISGDDGDSESDKSVVHLSFGFSSSIASQVAKVASDSSFKVFADSAGVGVQKRSLVGEETTFGDSDSDS
uniref:uncharacterized protein LOC120336345 isoform X1 n=3 Tax=Styela clava TaxID=7725 RepID=UPI00193A7BFB|nr:uncharacterized protein LOC120336345 isoform X1 [Styela clava]XP_039259944.1 uncharacterized protein LOC120336345 isoform X1 [Styela clava]